VSRMWWRAIGVACVLAGASGAQAAEPRKLTHLIPTLYGPAGLFVDSAALLPSGQTHSAHFNSDFQAEFSQLNMALVSRVASTPLPSPASSYTYTYDSETGVFLRSTGSFGPILGVRAETIGKNKLSLGSTYQSFSFDTIEGLNLRQVPAVFTHDNPAPGGRNDVVTTMNSVDLQVDQLTTFVTWGLASRLDLSLAVPVVRVDMTVTSDATVQRIGTSSNPMVHFFQSGGTVGNTRRFESAGQAEGLGDLVVRLKGTALRGRRAAVALGVDVRVPTGDEEDLLGSGAVGVRPFLVFSSVHRIAPHLDFGFQWNGKSVLAGDVDTGRKGTLPHQMVGGVGVDVRVSNRLTLALDLLGRRTIDSPRLQEVTFQAIDSPLTFPDIQFGRGSFNTLDGSTGLKWNPFGTVLIDANVLFKLNEQGVRDGMAPLLGIEYSF
jgi:hypothetical protein